MPLTWPHLWSNTPSILEQIATAPSLLPRLAQPACRNRCRAHRLHHLRSKGDDGSSTDSTNILPFPFICVPVCAYWTSFLSLYLSFKHFPWFLCFSLVPGLGWLNLAMFLCIHAIAFCVSQFVRALWISKHAQYFRTFCVPWFESKGDILQVSSYNWMLRFKSWSVTFHGIFYCCSTYCTA